ncbi:MAG: hypothetical protein IKG30_06330 [Clostridiales bacterium]|nr:hypothetical protein [Clostridiales bacterium]
MPHSSGGGSHGGGSHGGGSHGGGSSNRVSNHYFYGARRYRRHHRHTGQDEYVYANSKPQKASLFSIFIIVVVGAVFLFGVGFGMRPEFPKPLNGPFYAEPAVYDDIGMIADDDTLTGTLNDYYGLTGICPAIYTVYRETWEYEYADLETYAYCTYVENFEDESHFVIVYSVPESDAELVRSGKLDVPNYEWEAVQGDDTDLILTEGMFRRFANLIQDDLEAGKDPGIAFDNAFKFAIKDAESSFNPVSLSRIVKIIRSIIPMLLVGGIIVPMLILSIKTYIRDRDVEYEEVPLDDGDTTSYSGGSGSSGLSVGGYAQNSSGYSRSFSESTKKLSMAGTIFGLIFVTPFVLTGIGFIIGGIVLLSNVDKNSGGFMLLFGIIWTLISLFILASMIFALIKVKSAKTNEAPLTAEYPKAEYPDVNTDDPVAAFVPSNDQPNPFVPLKDQPSPFVPSADKEEFDQRFFEPAKSNIEEDDEDYKRMKRKGFE